MGNPASVAHPIKTHLNGDLIWSQEEIEYLKTNVPNPYVTIEEIQESLYWRTWNAINLKASRLGLKVQWEAF